LPFKSLIELLLAVAQFHQGMERVMQRDRGVADMRVDVGVGRRAGRQFHGNGAARSVIV
jgi:hypothetical protein